MKKLLTRLTALWMCLCLLSLPALADTNDGTPVTRSQFELSFHLYADGYPDDGLMHYQDWETFLSKLSLRGTVDAQSFPSPYDRVYFNGGVYLKDKLTIPFEYDGYHSFRYLRSPALGGASLHFQMFNFFQFMLKPYYYLTLRTPYAALLLYPEAAVEVWDKYAQPIQKAARGKKVSYEKLASLAGKLNKLALEDDYDKTYYFFTSLLIDQGLDWTAMEKLASWDKLLDSLDPEKKGMTISRKKQSETWTIGGTAIYQKTVSDGETAVRVYLPDPDGYEFSVELTQTPDRAEAQLLVLLEGDEYLSASVGIDGLPADGQLAAQGTAWLEVTGSGLYQEIAPLNAVWNYSRTADKKPCDMTLTVDLLNNETEEPCLGFTCKASVSEQPHTVLVERAYDDQEDFFHLNESFLEEHKERFTKTLALAAAPIALAVPAGVISDTVAYMEETGILAFLGIE